MAEHLIVDPVVEGSSPFYHPLLRKTKKPAKVGFFDSIKCSPGNIGFNPVGKGVPPFKRLAK